MTAFFLTRLRKILIWQKFLKRESPTLKPEQRKHGISNDIPNVQMSFQMRQINERAIHYYIR